MNVKFHKYNYKQNHDFTFESFDIIYVKFMIVQWCGILLIHRQ